MARQDLVASIRNAVERGYSLEQARQSLINSGYSEEVNNAVNYLTSGFGELEPANPYDQLPETSTSQETEQKIKIEKPKKRSQFSWKLLSIIIFLLIIVGFLIFIILARENFISFFENLFP